jgi:DnaK suppressor protein
MRTDRRTDAPGTDKTQENLMDPVRAKERIMAERERVTALLQTATGARLDDNAAEKDAGDDDTDGAQPLEHREIDSAVVRSLQARLDALSRAEQRLADGTYWTSVESGLPIPDERLEIDPAADRTVEEAERHEHHDY